MTNQLLAATQQTSTAENITPTTINEVDVTTYVADETTNVQTNVVPTNVVPSIFESVHVPGVNTLTDFLEKPTIVANGTLSTTDSAGVPLSSWYFPSEIMNKAKQTTKFKGILMYRADIELTIKVNATRFQQGRYFLRAVYTGGISTSASTTKLLGAHVSNLMTSTSGPRVEFDVATQTTATIDIPYTSLANYSLVDYSNTQAHDFVRVSLIPYDPLSMGSGDASCQYTVWCRFKNIVTSGNVVLQSASRVELSKKNLGPISGVAAKISQTANVFGSVPLLSQFTGTVSWLSNLVGRAAQIWGYSKPLTLDPPKTIVRRAVTNAANVDGVFTGHKLSASCENEVPINLGRSATKVDEMSFQFIATYPAWIKTLAWTDVQSSGTLISSFPTVIGVTDSVSLGKGGTLTPVDYLSTLFQFYRGSLRYKFKLPKTEFHSGRLLIAWQPYDSSAAVTSPSTLGDTDNMTRLIWDIRESNECEIVVPFVNTVNFLDINTPTGYLYIFVLNELIAPSTVSSQINILIEKSATEDIEFSCPIYGSTTSQTYWEPYIQFQSANSIHFGTGSSPPIVAAESSGEVIKSVRSLLKRFVIFWSRSSSTTQMVDLWPFESYVVGQITSTAGALVRTSMWSDYLSFLSPCYAFSSGSVRLLAAFKDTSTLVNWSLATTNGTPTDGVTLTATMAINPRVPITPVPGFVEGVSCIEIPQYVAQGGRSVSNRLPGGATVFSSQPSAKLGGSNMVARITSPVTVDFSTNPLFVYRAAADDFSLSVWNGTIPVVASNTL